MQEAAPEGKDRREAGLKAAQQIAGSGFLELRLIQASTDTLLPIARLAGPTSGIRDRHTGRLKVSQASLSSLLRPRYRLLRIH